MNHKNKKFVVLIIIFFIFFGVISSAYALNLKDAFGIGNRNNNDPLDKAASGAGYETDNASGRFDLIIGVIIQAALSLLGVIFLVLMIYGGYLWMTARGNEQQLEKAKNLITAALIGLVIVIAAYAISYFVISQLTTNTLTAVTGG